MNEPSKVLVQGDPADGLTEARPGNGPSWSAGEVEWTAEGDVRVSSSGEISRVALRWAEAVPAGALVLGDAWERSYGDLQWRHLQPERERW
ncbi:MAG TPA: hypothetical protein VGD71_29570, partial [Kribbella sp.]